MGKNNRARRAAKVRERQRRAAGRGDRARGPRGGGGDEPWSSIDSQIDGLVDLGPVRLAAGDRRFAERAAQRLTECPRRAVVRALEGELLRAVGRLFAAGWQPSEVMRQARRSGGATHAALVATVIVAHHTHSPAEPIDPRWQRQLAAVCSAAVGGGSDRDAGWFSDWSESAALEPHAELMETFELLVTIRSLPPIEELIPPPGSRATSEPSRPSNDLSDDDQRLLERVRNLLDKAESTEFEAEAEAFTAKAHELITRHAIDMALLAGATGHAADEQPAATRIEIDDPYADAKSLLVQIVAEANRCRAVYHARLAFSTVLGFPADLAATEMLYTSLLVQAQAALAAAGRSAPPGARTRSRSYRSAFLVAYAKRIGQRLDEISEHLVGDASGDGAALPVLRSREATVEDALTARFPEMTASAVRGGHDAAGWARGRLAADQAQLSFADLTDEAVGEDEPVEPVAIASGR